MPVFAIDLGTLNTKVAITRKGGVDIVTNEVSKRETTTMVSFVNEERFIGEQALDRFVRNAKNTAFLVKRLVGMKMSDPQLEYERKWITCDLKADDEDRLMMGVNYCEEMTYFYPEQILAMMLQKLQSYVDAAATTPQDKSVQTRDCVITIPCFYTMEQRKLVYQAAEAANLHCLMVETESSAVAVDYGIFRGANLKETQNEAQVVGILDIGYAATTFVIYKIWRGHAQMVAQSFDRNCGTRDIDYELFMVMKNLVKEKYKLDVSTNQRASLRVLEACEKLKYQLSANQAVPVHVENVLDVDISIPSFERSRLEEVSAQVLDKVWHVLLSGLKMADIEGDGLHSLEMIGGGSRIPMFKSLAERVLGNDRMPSFTLNASESIARGAAVLAAVMSPLYQVRKFEVRQLPTYPVLAGYFDWRKGALPEKVSFLPDVNVMVPLLRSQQQFPADLELLLPFNKNAVKLYIFYDYEDERVKKELLGNSLLIEEVDILPSGKKNEITDITVRLRVSQDGLIRITSAKGKAEQKAEVEEPAVEKAAEEAPASKTNEENNTAPSEKQKTKHRKVEYVTCGMNPKVNLLGHPPARVEKFRRDESAMHDRDQKIVLSRDKRNELEACILNFRSRLSKGEMLYDYATEAERTNFLELAEKYEDWLLGEGDNCASEEYDRRTQDLSTIGNAAYKRYIVREEVEFVKNQFYMEVEKLIQSAIRNGETGAEAATVEKAVHASTEARNWAQEEVKKLLALPKCQDGKLSTNDFMKKLEEIRALTNACNYRPPKAEPAPAPPSPATDAKSAEEAKAGPEASENQSEMAPEDPPSAVNDAV